MRKQGLPWYVAKNRLFSGMCTKLFSPSIPNYIFFIKDGLFYHKGVDGYIGRGSPCFMPKFLFNTD